MRAAPISANASLFVTCIIDQLYPEVGESAVSLLRRLGVNLDFPGAQTCCGQPAFNAGFWSDAKPLARRSIDLFQSDRYVVVPSGSCASMMRVFYAELFHDEPPMRALRPSPPEPSNFLISSSIYSTSLTSACMWMQTPPHPNAKLPVAKDATCDVSSAS